MKFGGTSVSDSRGISKIIDIVRKSKSKGDDVVLAVSAMAGMTDSIIDIIQKARKGDQEAIKEFVKNLEAKYIELAEDILQKRSIEPTLNKIRKLNEEFERILLSVSYLKEATSRSQDYILSFGEKFSAIIIRAALEEANIKAKWFSGGEAGIVTDDNFGEANPLMNITTLRVKERLEPVLRERVIPVVTGYIAHTQDEITTTLGRGGSDYTATLLGSALEAEEVHIWTDVDGLMTTDPKIDSSARTIPHISYAEAIEMAYFGAKGMHPKSLEPAMMKSILVRIKNTFATEKAGTLIAKDQRIKSLEIVKAVVIINNVALITVSGAGMVGMPGVASSVFEILGRNQINILMISQSSSEANISFIIPRSSLDKAVNTLELALLGRGIIKEISSERDTCVIAVVGAGMKGTPGVAARVFKCVADHGINIRMIAQGSSELNISFVVKEREGSRAVRLLHKEFHLYR